MYIYIYIYTYVEWGFWTHLVSPGDAIRYTMNTCYYYYHYHDYY